MAVALEQFVKHLEDSGILAGDTLQNFLPPKASPKDAEELARELVRHKKLTRFQAELLWQGKGKSLVLGNYLLLEKIGQGGMGAVYKAEHRRMKRIVAIKMLPPSMMSNAAAAARFQREVEAAAKLRHTNIVAADDADCANGIHFLVMECVEGSDLSALVKKNGPFPVNRAVDYILQAAKGLEYAHKRGVIHRDIKPANLLLDKEGTVKILDMGLARIETAGEAAAQAELTGTGAVMGTVDYMAPEQAMSTKSADARADIYSLGCSLYFLLTGKATFDGETITAKLIAHQSQAIPELRQECGAASAELEAVFKKMMAKKTQDRYQTMSELIVDLQRLGTEQQSSVTLQQAGSLAPSSNSNSDMSELNFLQDIQLRATIPQTRMASVSKDNSSHPPWKNPKALIGAAVLGVLLIAGISISLSRGSNTSGGKKATTKLLAPLNKPRQDSPGESAPIATETRPTTPSIDPDRRAAEWALSRGGFVHVAEPGKDAVSIRPGTGLPDAPFRVQVIEFYAVDQSIEDSELACLEGLKDLKELSLTRLRGYSDLGLKHLAGLTALKKLAIFNNDKVTDAGIQQLAGLKNLEDLQLAATQVSEAGLRAFSGCPLRRLIAGGRPAAESMLPVILQFTGLESLELHGTIIGDADVYRLQSLPHLKQLGLLGSRVTDEGLKTVATLKIQHLEFDHGMMTDAGLKHLEGMSSLQKLGAWNTQFTPAALTALQKALPNCEVKWNEPTKTE